MELLGHVLTVSGISDSAGSASIENSDSESGDYSTGVLTIDGAASSVFNGCLRNNGGNGAGNSLWSRAAPASWPFRATGAACTPAD